MVSFRTSVTVSLAILSVLGWAQAIPLANQLGRLSPSARNLLKRSTPAAPHFVAYNDKWLNPLSSASDLLGFNVFALSFLLSSGAADEAQNWQELTDSQRTACLQEYNAAGISLIVSAFGSTETPTSSGVDAVTAANTLAGWVIQYGVNGIDIDYEDLAAFDSGGGSAESWLMSFTQQLRTKLPQGQYILSHAPLAPWFSPSMWSGGGYLAVDKNVGSLIDWFYNQGTSEYTICSGLLDASTSAWPETALFEIAANGVSLDKLLIGKPATTSDASNGYIDPSTLLRVSPRQLLWVGINAGVMVWQYPDADSSWITTVRGKTWLVSGSPSPMSTGTSGTGDCSGVSAWSSSVAYSSGSKATYNGNIWTASQWNQNETPGGSSGAWTNDSTCT